MWLCLELWLLNATDEDEASSSWHSLTRMFESRGPAGYSRSRQQCMTGAGHSPALNAALRLHFFTRWPRNKGCGVKRRAGISWCCAAKLPWIIKVLMRPMCLWGSWHSNIHLQLPPGRKPSLNHLTQPAKSLKPSQDQRNSSNTNGNIHNQRENKH